jgi:chromosomal replication initiator protein
MTEGSAHAALVDRWRQFVAGLGNRGRTHATGMDFIRRLHPVGLVDGLLTITPENEFVVDLIRSQYLVSLQEWVDADWGEAPPKLEIRYVAEVFEARTAPTSDLPLFSSKDDDAPFADEASPDSGDPASSRRAPVRRIAKRPTYGSPLNPEMTLANFLADNSNDEAFFAATQFSGARGARFNPLYIHGQSGTGKTHLLNAIGNAVKARSPQTPVLYFTGDEFVTAVIDHIRSKRMAFFRKGTQLAGAMLLVDDVQLLSGKEASLDELFNLVNWHTLRGAQLAFTSDIAPAQIRGMSERLRTRMSEGLVVGVSPPLFETRVAIAQATADQLSEGRMPLSQDVAERVADQFPANTRELIGAVRRLLLRADFQSLDRIDLELTESVFGASRARRLSRTPENIAKCICEALQVDLSAVQGPGRTRRLVEARIWVAGLVREDTPASQMEIGLLLGRDHSTIHHTLSRYQSLLKTAGGAARREELKRHISAL